VLESIWGEHHSVYEKSYEIEYQEFKGGLDGLLEVIKEGIEYFTAFRGPLVEDEY